MSIAKTLTVPLISALCCCAASAQLELPGSQPLPSKYAMLGIRSCASCHSRTQNGHADPFFSWKAGVMSLAARDPVFFAAMAIANQDVPGAGEFCLRCHSPGGFLEGRAQPADGSALTPDDRVGVSCSVCHLMINPTAFDARSQVKTPPPGYGNAMYVIAKNGVMQGPYSADGKAFGLGHGVSQSTFHASGELCGVCHDVSNAFLAEDVAEQPPYAYGLIERTYSEWKLSEYAARGPAGACQACHLPRVEGGGYPTGLQGNPKREYFVEHGAVGGSAWIQDAVLHAWPDVEFDKAAMRRGQTQARAMLKKAASLTLSSPKPGRVLLKITNETGHKLPTGYPEGRRMWINAKFFNAGGDLLHEIGRYGDRQEEWGDQSVNFPTLLDPERTRVYECLPGLSPAAAKKYGKSPGASFFFILNDMIVKDNRIPPRGFNNAAFAERLCKPVGAEYADGQHWDDFELPVPPDAARVVVRLMYQSVSAEYVKFLLEEDRTAGWGKRVYEAWTQTGYCPPEIMVEADMMIP